MRSARKPIAERRAQLVDAALSLAIRSGIEAVTIREVAKEAGVSLGTVHYCFRDKDELLDATGLAVTRAASEQVEVLIEAGAAEGLGQRELAGVIAQALLTGLKRDRHKRLLLIELAAAGSRNQALRRTAQTHMRASVELSRTVAEAFARVSHVKYTVDIADIAAMITAIIDGVEIAWHVEQDDERALAGFRMMIEMLSAYVTRDDNLDVTEVQAGLSAAAQSLAEVRTADPADLSA